MTKLTKDVNLVKDKVLFKGDLTEDDLKRISEELGLKSADENDLAFESDSGDITAELSYGITANESEADRVEKALGKLGYFDKTESHESREESLRFQIGALKRQYDKLKESGKEDKELEDLIKQLEDRYNSVDTERLYADEDESTDDKETDPDEVETGNEPEFLEEPAEPEEEDSEVEEVEEKLDEVDFKSPIIVTYDPITKDTKTRQIKAENKDAELTKAKAQNLIAAYSEEGSMPKAMESINAILQEKGLDLANTEGAEDETEVIPEALPESGGPGEGMFSKTFSEYDGWYIIGSDSDGVIFKTGPFNNDTLARENIKYFPQIKDHDVVKYGTVPYWLAIQRFQGKKGTDIPAVKMVDEKIPQFDPFGKIFSFNKTKNFASIKSSKELKAGDEIEGKYTGAKHVVKSVRKDGYVETAEGKTLNPHQVRDDFDLIKSEDKTFAAVMSESALKEQEKQLADISSRVYAMKEVLASKFKTWLEEKFGTDIASLLLENPTAAYLCYYQQGALGNDSVKKLLEEWDQIVPVVVGQLDQFDAHQKQQQEIAQIKNQTPEMASAPDKSTVAKAAPPDTSESPAAIAPKAFSESDKEDEGEDKDKVEEKLDSKMFKMLKGFHLFPDRTDEEIGNYACQLADLAMSEGALNVNRVFSNTEIDKLEQEYDKCLQEGDKSAANNIKDRLKELYERQSKTFSKFDDSVLRLGNWINILNHEGEKDADVKRIANRYIKKYREDVKRNKNMSNTKTFSKEIAGMTFKDKKELDDHIKSYEEILSENKITPGTRKMVEKDLETLKKESKNWSDEKDKTMSTYDGWHLIGLNKETGAPLVIGRWGTPELAKENAARYPELDLKFVEKYGTPDYTEAIEKVRPKAETAKIFSFGTEKSKNFDYDDWDGETEDYGQGYGQSGDYEPGDTGSYGGFGGQVLSNKSKQKGSKVFAGARPDPDKNTTKWMNWMESKTKPTHKVKKTLGDSEGLLLKKGDEVFFDKLADAVVVVKGANPQMIVDLMPGQEKEYLEPIGKNFSFQGNSSKVFAFGDADRGSRWQHPPRPNRGRTAYAPEEDPNDRYLDEPEGEPTLKDEIESIKRLVILRSKYPNDDVNRRSYTQRIQESLPELERLWLQENPEFTSAQEDDEEWQHFLDYVFKGGVIDARTLGRNYAKVDPENDKVVISTNASNMPTVTAEDPSNAFDSGGQNPGDRETKIDNNFKWNKNFTKVPKYAQTPKLKDKEAVRAEVENAAKSKVPFYTLSIPESYRDEMKSLYYQIKRDKTFSFK